MLVKYEYEGALLCEGKGKGEEKKGQVRARCTFRKGTGNYAEEAGKGREAKCVTPQQVAVMQISPPCGFSSAIKVR